MLYSLENSPKLLQQMSGCRDSWRLFEINESTNKPTPDHLTKYRVVPCTCGLEACRYCRKRVLNQIRQKLLKKGFNQSWYMFTLAGVHHQGEESEDLKRLEISFRKLIQHLKRKFKKIEYVAIKELSPRGNWHIHGFWNFRFDWYELRDTWEKYSGSRSVYLKAIYSPEGAVHYTVSYMLKLKNFEQEACTLHANRIRKCTSSKQFFQKETAQKLYHLAQISDSKTEFFLPALKYYLKENKISPEEVTFIDFPYENEIFENYKPQGTEDPEIEPEWTKTPRPNLVTTERKIHAETQSRSCVLGGSPPT